MKTIIIRGDAFAVGEQLGQAGKSAWHHKLRQTTLWQTVFGLKDSPQAQAMAAMVQQQYPLIWQELTGLASGLEADISEVFAWNCRGDLVRSTSDGCTTLAGYDDEGRILIAHNEDGFPQLRDDCFIADVRPQQGAAFISFAYPGSLCGHTVSVNQFGLVNTVNNIRALVRPQGFPRQVLAREALNAASLDQAVAVLTDTPRAGAFHHTLACAGDTRILSVEATGTGCSVQPLRVSSGHANHLIHTELQSVEQVITDSSASRQQVIAGILPQDSTLSAALCLTILSDQRHPQLPIYRLAEDDPDQENTLATALFTVSEKAVSWSVFRADRQHAELQGICKQP